jgi:hypothetical protein
MAFPLGSLERSFLDGHLSTYTDPVRPPGLARATVDDAVRDYRGGSPQYRIKSLRDGHEGVVTASDIA